MATIKITQLPLITQLNANTSNTVFVAVDAQTEITGKITATTLAAGLYANNALNLSTKGIIHTPTIFPSSQTAITISMSNNSLVRAQTATGLVVTLSNFVAGKSVEAWITNTANNTQTFTHGVSAINSTVSTTTYSIPGVSTIFVKYWSMDGTLANTFVSITK
jgi:hypothetical protein